MLKKLVLTGIAATAFAGLGVAAPAQAALGNENEINVSEQSGNFIVCGNRAIGDVFLLLVPLTPITIADRTPVNCSVTATQK